MPLLQMFGPTPNRPGKISLDHISVPPRQVRTLRCPVSRAVLGCCPETSPSNDEFECLAVTGNSLAGIVSDRSNQRPTVS